MHQTTPSHLDGVDLAGELVGEDFAGDTRHLKFGPGKYLLHDLCNDGPTDLEFMTVEHVRRPGEPGPPTERVSDSVDLPSDQSPSTQRHP
jgi:hypothetical protein